MSSGTGRPSARCGRCSIRTPEGGLALAAGPLAQPSQAVISQRGWTKAGGHRHRRRPTTPLLVVAKSAKRSGESRPTVERQQRQSQRRETSRDDFCFDGSVGRRSGEKDIERRGETFQLWQREAVTRHENLRARRMNERTAETGRKGEEETERERERENSKERRARAKPAPKRSKSEQWLDQRR